MNNKLIAGLVGTLVVAGGAVVALRKPDPGPEKVKIAISDPKARAAFEAIKNPTPMQIRLAEDVGP